MYKEPSREVLSRIANALSIPPADLFKEAGLDHLLLEDNPSLESAVDSFAPKLTRLPRRDRDIILGEIRRILHTELSEGK